MNLLYVNKRKRRGGRRMPARNARGRFVKGGGHRKRRSSSRRRRTRAFHMRGRSHAVVRVRRGSRSRSVYKNARRRHRRSNPSLRLGGARGIFGPVMDSFIGAGGAIVVDALQVRLPLPAQLNTGRMTYVTSYALAFLLGMLGRKLPVVGPFAGKMANGSMTVTAYKAIHDFLPATMAQVSGLGWVAPAQSAGAYPMLADVGAIQAGNDTIGEYVSGVGEYVSGI